MRVVRVVLVPLFAMLSVSAALAQEYIRPAGNGRVDFGWQPNDGAALEAYSANATNKWVERKGEFKFIYGGGPDMGRVVFTHFNGSNWMDKIVIMSNGDLVTKGTVKATEMIVGTEEEIWPDYVFEDTYQLRPLKDLKTFIEQEGHLPGIPTAKDVAEDGHNLGLMSAKTLEKVEELTLYMIELKEENEALKAELDALRLSLQLASD